MHRAVRAVAIGALMVGVTTMSALATPAAAQTGPAMGTDSAAPYMRYQYPIECAMVQPRRERLFWRDQRPDTVYHPPMGDVPFAFAVASARECVSRYTLATVPQRDLIGYGAALLTAQEWPQAEDTFHRLLGALANGLIYDKARALVLITGLYASTTGQMPLALTYQRQLEALGDVAAPERMLGQLSIANRALFADSLSLLDSALAGALKASRAMTGDTAKHYAFVSAQVYLDLAELYARRHQPDKAISTIVQGRSTLVPIRQSVMRTLGGAEGQFGMLGKPAPQLKASVWYGDEGAATQRPTKGKPTLVVFAYHNCGDRCYPGYAVLRRLYAKYAGTGLQIVFASRTMGFYLDDLVKPEAEATLIQHYFTDTLKLPPLTLAVWETPFTKRETDGRRMVTSAPNEESYHPNPTIPLPTYLIDRNGIIQAVTSLSPRNEAFLDHQLQQLH
jgi:hypothetical protein